MKTASKLPLLAILALLSLGAAQASPWAGPPAFADFDRDGNGSISQQEFDTLHAQRLQERAAQGYLLRHAGRHPQFAALDRDGDAVLSPEELAQNRPLPWTRPWWGHGPRHAGYGCPRLSR